MNYELCITISSFSCLSYHNDARYFESRIVGGEQRDRRNACSVGIFSTRGIHWGRHKNAAASLVTGYETFLPDHIPT